MNDPDVHRRRAEILLAGASDEGSAPIGPTPPPPPSALGADEPPIVPPVTTARRAASDVVIQLVGRVAMLAIGIVTTTVLVRALGTEAYGEWSTLFALSFIATQIAGFGMQQVVVREAAADGRVREWVGALLSLHLVMALVVAAGYVGVVLLLADTARMRNAGFVVASMLVLSVGSTMSVVFQLKVRNDIVTAIRFLDTIVWGAAVVALAAVGTGMWWFAVAFTATATLTAAIQFAAGVRELGGLPPLGRHLWPQLLRLGVPVGVSVLLILAYARIDQVLVFELAGSEQAGLYGAAYRFLDQAHLLPTAVLATLAPLLAAAHANDPARLRRLLGFAAELLAIGSFAGLALALPLASSAIAAIFGEEFRDAGGALVVLTAAFVVMCFGYLNGQLVLLYRLQKMFAVVALLALVLNLSLSLLLIPQYGYKAAAWVVLVTELFVNGTTMIIAVRAAGDMPPLGRLGRIALCAVATSAITWALFRSGIGWVPAGVAGTAAYAGLLLASGGLDRAQLLRLVRSRTV